MHFSRLILSFLTRRSFLAMVGISMGLCMIMHAQLSLKRRSEVLRPPQKENHVSKLVTSSQGETHQDAVPSEKLAVTIDFLQRKNLYEKKCRGRTLSNVGHVMIHPPSKLAVCHVPKVGCTFWKRLFRFLFKDFEGKKVKTLFDIDRHSAHFGGTKLSKTYGYRTWEGQQMADASKKVLFTRDPYTRLFSGYVDKFILPDSWADHGKAILHARKIKKGICPDDITFEEFLLYSFRNRDGHWRPIHDVCDPCSFKPDFVGHMSTFARDVKFILEDRNLSYLIEGYNHSNHVEDEFTIMIDYHYALYVQRPFVQSCLSTLQLAERLFRFFQLNGYFRLNDMFPHDEVKSGISVYKNLFETKVAVTQIFINKFRQDPMSHEELLGQRAKVLKEAYGNVSTRTKIEVSKQFRADFELFGFDPAPPDYRL